MPHRPRGIFMPRILTTFLWSLCSTLATVCAHEQHKNVLFLTETGSGCHGVIDTAYTAIETQLLALGWHMNRTDESSGYFTPPILDTFDVVVFFFTSGNDDPGILTTAEKQAFEMWYRNDKGFAGFHSAADTYETNWPWYHQLLGAGLKGHGPTPLSGTIRIEDRSFSAVSHLPEYWTIEDEW